MTPTAIHAEADRIVSPNDFKSLPRQENVIESDGQEEKAVGSAFQISTFYVEFDLKKFMDFQERIGDGIASTGDLEALAEDGGSFNFLSDPDEKTYDGTYGEPI